MFSFSNKYRVVTDEWNGFEAQVKRWYIPFWFQIHERNLISNTSCSLCDAQLLIEKHKANKIKSTHKSKEVWRGR